MKKFIILLFIILPLGLMAQEKMAYVNAGEVFSKMPENSKIENELVALQEKYTAELKIMQDEYTRKTSDYIAQQDSLTENIKVRRMQEIEEIRARTENFVTVAQQDMEKKRQELWMPVQEKIQKAIKDVGDEKGYTYIFDPQVFLYVSPNAVDATPFVKAKLGLQ